MSGPISLPLLRHPVTGTPLPWWDTRLVTPQTLCEYLGVDRAQYTALLVDGHLTPPGGAVLRGEKRPSYRFIPAVIWAHNRWSPTGEALAILATGQAEILALREATLRLCDGLLATATPPRVHAKTPPPIAFVVNA